MKIISNILQYFYVANCLIRVNMNELSTAVFTSIAENSSESTV
jgi:hypothetical protein